MVCQACNHAESGPESASLVGPLRDGLFIYWESQSAAYLGMKEKENICEVIKQTREAEERMAEKRGSFGHVCIFIIINS